MSVEDRNFEIASQPLGDLVPNLRNVASGSGAIYPTSVASEIDFSIVNGIFGTFGHVLTELSMGSVMQSMQYDKVTEVFVGLRQPTN